jgi:hypothetical protein
MSGRGRISPGYGDRSEDLPSPPLRLRRVRRGSRTRMTRAEEPGHMENADRFAGGPLLDQLQRGRGSWARARACRHESARRLCGCPGDPRCAGRRPSVQPCGYFPGQVANPPGPSPPAEPRPARPSGPVGHHRDRRFQALLADVGTGSNAVRPDPDDRLDRGLSRPARKDQPCCTPVPAGLGECVAASPAAAVPGLVLASPAPAGPGPDAPGAGGVPLGQAAQQPADLGQGCSRSCPARRRRLLTCIRPGWP